MFSAGFGLDKCTGLVPLEGDPEVAHGGITAWVISRAYEAWLSELVGPGDIFMYESSSCILLHFAGQSIGGTRIPVGSSN